MLAATGLLVVLSACGQRNSSSSDGAPGLSTSDRPAMTEADLQAQSAALLAKLGAPAAAAARAQYAGAFDAFGVEPDWRLTLLPDFVSFSRPGLEEITAIPSARDIRQLGAYVAAGPLSIALTAGACTYSEGGESFPFTATVLFEGVAYEGCARAGTGEAAAVRGWEVNLPQLLPAIDACLARVQARPGRVTISYVNDEGQTAVRLLEADGGRSECLVAPDGATVASVDPLADRDVFPGERDPLFTRAPSSPPPASCYSNEEVKGSSGATLGWLSRKTC
jgi:uncharacterized membrane protein